MQRLRTGEDLLKPPGVAETLDWARALRGRSAPASSTWRTPPRTLGAVVKYREDAERVRAGTGPDARRHDRVTGPGDPRHEADELLLGFARALRAAGVPVTQDRAQAYLRAVAVVGIDDQPATYWAGRATLCAGPGRPGPLRPGVRRLVPRRGPVPVARRCRTRRTDRPGRRSSDRRRRRRASGDSDESCCGRWPATPRCSGTATSPTWRRAEKARLAGAVRAPCDRAPAAAARPPPYAVAPRRRRRPAHPAADAAGGWASRPRSPGGAAPTRPRRVVLLVDVSGSMSAYADALLRLAHRFSHPGRPAAPPARSRCSPSAPG